MTREQAIAFHDSGAWRKLSPATLALFQLTQSKLGVPFGEFHKAVEIALGRPVWTHEFALNREGLLAELQGKAATPSLEEVIGLIPSEKLLVLALPRTRARPKEA